MEESEFLKIINDYREQNGVQPLKISDPLNNASIWMSKDMADNNYLNHTDSRGKSLRERMIEFGYTNYKTIGENIAAGYNTANKVFEGWKKSEGHNRNMLNPNYTEIGIGLGYNANSTYKYYWCTNFGSKSREVIEEFNNNYSTKTVNYLFYLFIIIIIILLIYLLYTKNSNKIIY